MIKIFYQIFVLTFNYYGDLVGNVNKIYKN